MLFKTFCIDRCYFIEKAHHFMFLNHSSGDLVGDSAGEFRIWKAHLGEIETTERTSYGAFDSGKQTRILKRALAAEISDCFGHSLKH